MAEDDGRRSEARGRIGPGSDAPSAGSPPGWTRPGAAPPRAWARPPGVGLFPTFRRLAVRAAAASVAALGGPDDPGRGSPSAC